MDIHKPKPWRGLREFVKEYAIIVVGVLTALAGEQTVEAFHWRHRVHDAVEAMRLELRYDDGPQGFVRIAAEPCFARKLDTLQAAIEAGKDRREIAGLVDAYRPPIRTWDAAAWNAAIASGVGGHVSAEQMVDWSKPYRTIPDLQTVNNQERADWVSLQPRRLAAGRPSPVEEDAMLAAIQRLRKDNLEMGRLSRTQFYGLEKYRMNLLPDQQQRILEGLRTRYGDCVVAPSTAGVHPDDQLNDLRP